MQTSLTSDISIFKFAFVASDFARFRARLRPNSWGGRGGGGRGGGGAEGGRGGRMAMRVLALVYIYIYMDVCI